MASVSSSSRLFSPRPSPRETPPISDVPEDDEDAVSVPEPCVRGGIRRIDFGRPPAKLDPVGAPAQETKSGGDTAPEGPGGRLRCFASAACGAFSFPHRSVATAASPLSPSSALPATRPGPSFCGCSARPKAAPAGPRPPARPRRSAHRRAAPCAPPAPPARPVRALLPASLPPARGSGTKESAARPASSEAAPAH